MLKADKDWIAQCNAGRFSVTFDGKIINKTTVKELAKKRSNNPCIQFRVNGNWLSLTKGRAVWLAKFGEIPDGNYVSFKDGDNFNTHPDNLVLKTTSEMAQVAAQAGIPFNVPPPRYINSKLTLEIVNELRKQARAGVLLNHREIAKKYSVDTIHCIAHAIRGKTFMEASEPPVKDYKTVIRKINILTVDMVIDLRKRSNAGEVIDAKALAQQLGLKSPWAIVDAIRGKTFTYVKEPTFDFHIPRVMQKGLKRVRKKLNTVNKITKPRVAKPKTNIPKVAPPTLDVKAKASAFMLFRQRKNAEQA